MQKIEHLEAGKIYLIESTASANSVYFETDNLAKLFFRYCDYYLKDYLHVEEYVLNKDGWAMLIKVRSAKTILKHYRTSAVDLDEKTQDDARKTPLTEIWRILSERVRLFISTYVRMSNKILGREGSLVRRKYGRYHFDTIESAQDYVANIRNDRHEMAQPEEKYRGFAEHFRMSRDILTNPWRSSLWLEMYDAKDEIMEELVEIFSGELAIFKGLGHLVAPKFKLEKSTKKLPPTKPPKH